MPELAEVEFCKRQWEQHFPFTIEEIHTSDTSRVFRDQSIENLKTNLKGTTLVSSFRHGKQLFFKTDDDQWLNVHLGMTGYLSVKSSPEEWKKRDALVLSNGDTILHFDDFRMFGKVCLLEALPPLATPDPVDKDYDLETFSKLAIKYGKKQLKAFLLDQKCCPGFGNWMVDEVMWRAGYLPNRKVQDCETSVLYDTIKFVAIKSIYYVADRAGEPTTTYKKNVKNSWGAPPEGWLFQVRWKKDMLCPTCNQLLARETMSGRTTCFCPKCQK